MVKVSVNCTCRKCGLHFVRTVYKLNPKEASRWEAWAKENINECEACYCTRRQNEAERNEARTAAMAVAKGWPMLTGSRWDIPKAEAVRRMFDDSYSCYRNDSLEDIVDFMCSGKDDMASQLQAKLKTADIVYHSMLKEHCCTVWLERLGAIYDSDYYRIEPQAKAYRYKLAVMNLYDWLRSREMLLEENE